MPVYMALPQPPVPPVINTATQSWPVIDNGSAAVPNGFGSTLPAFGVLSAVGQQVANLVQGLSEPGTYADAGILGAVQSAAQNPGIDTQQLQAFFAKFNGTPKPGLDDLVSQVVTADLAITGNPGLLAMFKSGAGPTATETWFNNPIASDNTGFTILQPTASGTGSLGKVIAGFTGMMVQSTGDGPATTADGALPMSSFVFDYQKPLPFFDVIKQLRQPDATTTNRPQQSAHRYLQTGACDAEDMYQCHRWWWVCGGRGFRARANAPRAQ